MNWRGIIKELRQKAFFTQEELAITLGVSFATVNRWENGKHEPSMKQRRQIVYLCKKYKIKIEG